jgi:hypothetical protein
MLDKYAKKQGCPVIYFLHSYFKNPQFTSCNFDESILLSESVAAIICISDFIKNSLPESLQSKAIVISPYFSIEKMNLGA